MARLCFQSDWSIYGISRMITKEEALRVFEYRDGKLYWKISKQKILKGGEAGSLFQNGYRNVSYNGKHMYTHRIIFLMHHGYLPPRLDHINGNPLDNRIENLRECNQSQNMWNRAVNKNNTSGFKGVYKVGNKWLAKICTNYKSKYIGTFNTVEEAKEAVMKYRKEIHKEFARHE